jgi:hypothetical protein
MRQVYIMSFVIVGLCIASSAHAQTAAATPSATTVATGEASCAPGYRWVPANLYGDKGQGSPAHCEKFEFFYGGTTTTGHVCPAGYKWMPPGYGKWSEWWPGHCTKFDFYYGNTPQQPHEACPAGFEWEPAGYGKWNEWWPGHCARFNFTQNQ